MAFTLAVLASLVSSAFAGLVWAQWSARRRRHQLAWALGLSAYAAASFMEAWVSVSPWSVGLYRLYFPLAASTVGLMGAGTMYLLRAGRLGDMFAGFVGVGILVAGFAPLAIPLTLDTPVIVHGVEVAFADGGPSLGGKPVPFSNIGRVAFLLLNVLGGLALIVGALWSAFQTRRMGVLLIGLGALLPFAGGGMSSLLGLDARVALQLAGIAVMFAGYTMGQESAARTPRGEGAAA